MKLKVRQTHSFVEISVDEIQTTIFQSDQKDLEDTIQNLLSVVDALSSYTKKELIEYVREGNY